MTYPIEATMWTAQTFDGKVYQGGKGDFLAGTDISTLDPAQVKSFQVSHNTFTDKFYQPRNAWFRTDKNGANQPIPADYPRMYTMATGSLLVVDQDGSGHLTLSEV